jgi:large subunit ribosomal protein L18
MNKRVKNLVRSKLKRQTARHVLVIHRTNMHIYAQLKTPGVAGTVIAAVSTLSKDVKAELKGKNSSNKDAAYLVGQHFAKLVKSKKIESVVVDRGGFLFWGRVKSLVKGVTDSGIII